MSKLRTMAYSEVLLGLGLTAYVLLVWWFESILGAKGPVRVSQATALILVCVPALVFLIYFYWKDRYEPEPTAYVGGVFLLGAFISYPVASWLLGDVVAAAELSDLKAFSVKNLVRFVLLIGVVQETLKYMAVRYTVYLSEEFDEPMDGIVYCVCAGIGFATAQNMQEVLSAGGVTPHAAAIRVVLGTLMHASLSGVVGYCLGRHKFSDARWPLWPLGGLIAASVLNGLFAMLDSAFEVSRSGLEEGLGMMELKSFIALGCFAMAIFSVVLFMMKRHLEHSFFRTDEEPAGERGGG